MAGGGAVGELESILPLGDEQRLPEASPAADAPDDAAAPPAEQPAERPGRGLRAASFRGELQEFRDRVGVELHRSALRNETAGLASSASGRLQRSGSRPLPGRGGEQTLATKAERAFRSHRDCARTAMENVEHKLRGALAADSAAGELAAESSTKAERDAAAEAWIERKEPGETAEQHAERLQDFLMEFYVLQRDLEHLSGSGRNVGRVHDVQRFVLVIPVLLVLGGVGLSLLAALVPGPATQVGVWAAAAAGMVTILVKRRSKSGLPHGGCLLALWCYMCLLLVLPASIMANGDRAGSANGPRAGGYLYLLVLWLSGWAFLW